MKNSFGRLFTITSFGESHGQCVGVVIDGCPAGLPLALADIQSEVDRRRAGGSLASTDRREKDIVEILSGISDDFTTGAPICLLIRNEDVDDTNYEKIRFQLRPGHADYTAFIKYGGFNDWRGGGRFSGRMTAGFVMAGAIAKKLLNLIGMEIVAHTVVIDSYGDHRIAMAFGVLGAAIGGVTITGAESVAKTFPTFWDILKKVGVRMETHAE